MRTDLQRGAKSHKKSNMRGELWSVEARRRGEDWTQLTISYPNVNTYASTPALRNVISSVRSRTVSCSRTSW
jgi:hypothetical protein